LPSGIKTISNTTDRNKFDYIVVSISPGQAPGDNFKYIHLIDYYSPTWIKSSSSSATSDTKI
jgi:hypothetical protein